MKKTVLFTVAVFIAAATQSNSAEPKTETACPIDLDKLTTILGDDDPSLHAEILEFFTECFGELHQRIAEALTSQDRVELRNAAHAAKGAAQNAGALTLSATLVSLERQALNGELPELEALSLDVNTHFGAVKTYVESLSATSMSTSQP